ncbi:RHG15 protein, partial [Oceanites oceanicus]|nr:RHG15 protein [Oceanites oceanicus]
PEERLSLTDPEWSYVHVVTGALKLFFRELPEPLVPYGLFDPFIEAISKCSPAVLPVGIPRLWDQAGWGPWDHPPILRIPRLMEQVDVNRMTCQNIGIVFEATLLRPEWEPGSLAASMAQQNQTVELLLAHFDHILPA